jgi:hypothetical protein
MSFNVNVVPQAPAPPQGTNTKPTINKTAEQPVVRAIPTIADYNTETGTAESRGEWKVADKTQKPKEAKKTSPKEEPKETNTNRHEEWKKTQAEKKQAKEETRYAKQVEKQALAKDYLHQGNITKAAEALGLSVPEFIALSQNAALSIPTEKKDLSPEEKRALEDKQYKESVQKELEDHRKYRYETNASNWTRDNIAPVMADTEKYQLLNLNKDNIPKIQRAVYEFLNQHYNETCVYGSDGKLVKDGEILNVADVLDTLETQTEEMAKQSLGQYKNVKKFSSLFQAEQEEKQHKTKVEPVVDEEPQEDLEQQLGSDEEEEDLQPQSMNITSGIRKNVPFALMTIEEKMAYMRSQKGKKH